MINMPYCRMRNTHEALEECVEAINNGEKLSFEEADSLRNIVYTAIGMMYDAGLLDIDNKPDDFMDRVDEWTEGMIKKEGK